MATNLSQGSAQIFQFPPRGRFAIGGDDARNKNAATFATSFPAINAISGAWYHDEAVRDDAEPTRKN